MLGETLIRLLEQAQQSEPPVRAPALLRIARVVSATDQPEALRIFDLGCEALSRVAGNPAQGLTELARLAAAAISPERVAALPASAESRVRFLFDSEVLVRVMVEHGHVQAAVTHVMGLEETSEFPFGMAGMLLARMPAGDPAGVALVRRAAEAWRKRFAIPEHQLHRARHFFVTLFEVHWTLLPHHEALAIVREITAEARTQTPLPATCTYDPERSVQITNVGEHRLFQVWHVLRALDPELAQSLLAEYTDLAAAVRRFPNGMESVRQEAEARRNELKGREAQCGGFIMGGHPDDFPYMESLMQAEKDGNFGRPVEFALERYWQDALSDQPNRALKEFWPSTDAFRSVLYRAGKRMERAEGGVYLNHIPDADIRLLAEIELEAALAGLPEFRSMVTRAS